MRLSKTGEPTMNYEVSPAKYEGDGTHVTFKYRGASGELTCVAAVNGTSEAAPAMPRPVGNVDYRAIITYLGDALSAETDSDTRQGLVEIGTLVDKLAKDERDAKEISIPPRGN